MNIIKTQSVQFAAYFQSCKNSQLYYQDKYLRRAKMIKL